MPASELTKTLEEILLPEIRQKVSQRLRFEYKTQMESLGKANLDLAIYMPKGNFWRRMEWEKRINMILQTKLPMDSDSQGKDLLPKQSLWTWLVRPRSLRIAQSTYYQLRLDFLDISQPKRSQIIQRPLGKIDCFFRVYELRSIQSLWRVRKFKPPYPRMADCYVRAKEIFSNGNYGRSHYVFLGRSLQNHNDNYLLTFWGLEGLDDLPFSRQIPNQIFEIESTQNRQRIETLHLDFGYLPDLSLADVNALLTGDQVSTSSLHHQG
ncbi:hypothetical protein [Leptospira ryugenii]|uniref:hypothetical protein n=1 Tax=Leptospira ryugenii TaxID=1917863 RepID=UPI00107F207D|nr:hypothetical protein [Leptospira ryugenii]